MYSMLNGDKTVEKIKVAEENMAYQVSVWEELILSVVVREVPASVVAPEQRCDGRQMSLWKIDCSSKGSYEGTWLLHSRNYEIYGWNK